MDRESDAYRASANFVWRGPNKCWLWLFIILSKPSGSEQFKSEKSSVCSRTSKKFQQVHNHVHLQISDFRGQIYRETFWINVATKMAATCVGGLFTSAINLADEMCRWFHCKFHYLFTSNNFWVYWLVCFVLNYSRNQNLCFCPYIPYFFGYKTGFFLRKQSKSSRSVL